MRKYLFGTGLFTAITGGMTLLRGMREDAPFTWRSALGWLSWGISLALAVGAIVGADASELDLVVHEPGGPGDLVVQPARRGVVVRGEPVDLRRAERVRP